MSELMETKKKFSLEELSELTGISRRTIRFYIQRGLMRTGRRKAGRFLHDGAFGGLASH